jgi:hypothetical protein
MKKSPERRGVISQAGSFAARMIACCSFELELDTARRLGATTLVLDFEPRPMISHPGETADLIEKAALALADVD